LPCRGDDSTTNFLCVQSQAQIFVVFPPIQSNGFNDISSRSAFGQRSTLLLPPMLASMAEDRELGESFYISTFKFSQ
jgi:hypothetical protein